MKLFHKWKAQPVEFGAMSHSYSLVSGYYEEKTIDGVEHYKITSKGTWKLKEGRLNVQTHNFMIYLAGEGLRKISGSKLENGVTV